MSQHTYLERPGPHTPRLHAVLQNLHIGTACASFLPLLIPGNMVAHAQ